MSDGSGEVATEDEKVSRASAADPYPNLPPANTRRWVPRRKAEVVAAVDHGILTAEEACQRYQLTMEEFEIWERMVRQHGQKGLRVTQLQRYQRRPLRRLF